MIRGLIETTLGQAGRAVLQFYEQHALVLGLIIVAYGILMFLSWQNLVHIYRFLVGMAAATLMDAGESSTSPRPDGGKRRRGDGQPTRERTSRPELPWQAAVDSVRFPFVSARAGLRPLRKTVAAAKSIIDERELWEHARAVAAGADVRRVAPAYRLTPPKRMEPHGKD